MYVFLWFDRCFIISSVIFQLLFVFHIQRTEGKNIFTLYTFLIKNVINFLNQKKIVLVLCLLDISIKLDFFFVVVFFVSDTFRGWSINFDMIYMLRNVFAFQI